MECRICGHSKCHKHGLMPNGHQRYFCPNCKQTFPESFDTLYSWRRVSPDQVQQVLQAHSEGSSLRGISRITELAYNTVVSIVGASSAKAQLVHKAQYYYGRLSQDQINYGGANLTTFPLQLLVNLCLKIILLVNLWLQRFFGSDHVYERINISEPSTVNL